MNTVVKFIYSLLYTSPAIFAAYAVVHYKDTLKETSTLLLLAGAAVLVTMYSAIKTGDIWRPEIKDSPSKRRENEENSRRKGQRQKEAQRGTTSTEKGTHSKMA